MSFAAQVQCEDGPYYDIEGEGGNIHAYRIRGGPVRASARPLILYRWP